jgi:hypothetical protein
MDAPGTKRLKLRYDGPLSYFAFKFNLRRYILEPDYTRDQEWVETNRVRLERKWGGKVGRCRLTPSIPH